MAPGEINAPQTKTIRPVWAGEEDEVQIHWRTNAGIVVQKCTCPPKATVRARVSGQEEPRERESEP